MLELKLLKYLQNLAQNFVKKENLFTWQIFVEIVLLVLKSDIFVYFFSLELHLRFALLNLLSKLRQEQVIINKR